MLVRIFTDCIEGQMLTSNPADSGSCCIVTEDHHNIQRGEYGHLRANAELILSGCRKVSDLQAEKRGNFVVIGCVEGSRVISWSLNVSSPISSLTMLPIVFSFAVQALNNSETLRLLASIELACYKCKQALADPRLHNKSRRRIERVIKDDRRRRHRRRKDQDAMVDAFAKQNLGEPME